MNLNLHITDPEVITELERHPAHDQPQFALAALKIGILSLRHASSNLDGELIRSNCDSLIKQNEAAMSMWASRTETLLKGYFGEGGIMRARLSELSDPETGKLAAMLREAGRALGSDIEARTAPLLAQLDPRTSGNLISRLTEASKEASARSQEQLLQAFSLDSPTSVLSRLVRELKTSNTDVNRVLETAVKEVASQLSLDNASSALSRLRSELLAISKQQETAATTFQRDVTATLASLAARKEEARRSTSHGVDFEARLAEFFETNIPSGHIVRRTGNTTGSIKNCKVGDITVELGPDAIGAGSLFVVEAKESRSYDLTEARQEIELARKNRKASAGLFVFSSETAPAGLPLFTRLGSDIFTIWDPEDPSTHPYLSASIQLAIALCVRESVRKSGQSADYSTLDSAILAVEKEATRLLDVTRFAETIKNSSEKIIDQCRRSTDNFVKLVAKLREASEGLQEEE